MEHIFPGTKVIFGNGSFSRLGEVARGYEGNVMLFTGKSSMRRLGYTDRAVEMLGNRKVVVYDKVEPSPQTETFMDALETARKEKIGLVIGLGGGSAIDVAKCVAAMVTNFKEGKDIRDYADNEGMVPVKGIPFIAIPTTSGTGAEVTRRAVVWDGKKKHTVSGLHMYANVAILDPELTSSLPKKQTASTGMDALSQAIEGFWSKNHDHVSDNFALKSIDLVFKHLRGAYNDPKNLEHRRGMLLAALYSGYAIDSAKTTACHSVSYPITSYFKVPHGHACALTVPSFLMYNYEAAPDRIGQIAKIMGVKTAEEAAGKVLNLMENLDLETRLSDLGIDEKGIEIIVENGFTPDRVGRNPRELNSDDLRKILRGII